MTPEHIRTLRAQTGLSQPRFAARITEVNPLLTPNGASVSRWESGANVPSVHTADALTRLWLHEGYPVTVTLRDGTERDGALTTNSSASSYGQPVVVIDGTAYGPADVVGVWWGDDAPDAIARRALDAGYRP